MRLERLTMSSKTHENDPGKERGAFWTGRKLPRRRVKHQDELGEEFDAVFNGLQGHWAAGLVRLKEFRKLFGDAERVQLLNAITGGALLWDIQQILWDDLMLRVSRLTDPVGSGSKLNLTVKKLPAFFCSDPKFCGNVKELVCAAVEAARFARDWRNRRISHSDLALIMSPNEKPLARATLQQVQVALDSVHAVLNTISKRQSNAAIDNDVSMSPKASAFVSYTSQLAEAVGYIDSLVDPSGTLPFTDRRSAGAFLSKLGVKPTWDQVKQIEADYRVAGCST